MKRTISVCVVVFLAVFTPVIFLKAGSLSPSQPPLPTMKTLDEIYNAVSDISGGLSRREGYCGYYRIEADTTADLLTTAAGKRFVLLKIYVPYSAWDMTVDGKILVSGSICDTGVFTGIHEFPDQCVVVEPGKTLRFVNRKGSLFPLTIIGYFCQAN